MAALNCFKDILEEKIKAAEKLGNKGPNRQTKKELSSCIERMEVLSKMNENEIKEYFLNLGTVINDMKKIKNSILALNNLFSRKSLNSMSKKDFMLIKGYLSDIYNNIENMIGKEKIKLTPAIYKEIEIKDRPHLKQEIYIPL